MDTPFSPLLSSIPSTPLTPVFSSTSIHGSSSPSRAAASVGPLVPVAAPSLADFPPGATALVPAPLFTAATLSSLKASAAAGALVLADEAAPFPSSPLPPSPFLPSGDGLAELDLHGLPVSYVSDPAAAALLAALASPSPAPPPPSAASNLYMGPPSATSASCLSWRSPSTGSPAPQCLPLGGQSVWSSYPPPSASPPFSASTLLAAPLDAASLLRDATPASNAAAGSVLAVLLAARAVGSLPPDVAADLRKRVAFGFFQGEAYGRLGSGRFFEDVSAAAPFECDAELTVPPGPLSFEPGAASCLHPLRASLAFLDLEPVTSLLAVDQVALSSQATFYAHYPAGNSTPTDQLRQVLALTAGAGYLNPSRLGTPHDTLSSLASVAAAATISARALVADALVSPETPPAAAASLAAAAIPSISADDPTAQKLFECFMADFSCDIVRDAVAADQARSVARLGWAASYYPGLGRSPPNYYTGVYSQAEGQPYAVVGGRVYGGYADPAGWAAADAPYLNVHGSALEVAVRELLSGYLNHTAHFHPALDRGFEARNGTGTGLFDVDENAGTPMFAEPNWADPGVVVFRDGEGWEFGEAGWWVAGLAVAGLAGFWGRRAAKSVRDKVA
ncbi:hypothetical protein TeGR_g3532 [Tetraparma gracilis]|uniref:Nicastrin n=1 Tax=Tetraparma gracilis TaxID=2962635 RepID=A0ABQ6NBG8_9STRA|nr:hypothetical protein TeGR_g3532 [Tetraparma gracilis]